MNTTFLFKTDEQELDQRDFIIYKDIRFSDDIWNLKGLKSNKRAGVSSSGQLNFTILHTMPLLMEPIKRYCYLHLGRVKIMTVADEYNSSIVKIIHFLKEQHLRSLEAFTTQYFIDFNVWLRENFYKGERSAKSLMRIANFLLQVINFGQSMGFAHLPQESIQLEISLWSWWRENRQKKKMQDEDIQDKSIPTTLWKNIINNAWSENDITKHIKGGKSKGLFQINNAKFGILIQAYTGLRISEILYLKTGCVEKDTNGQYWLNILIEKTEIEPIPHKILIPESIYELILRLDKLSSPLRLEAQEDQYLFYILSRPRQKEYSDSPSERFKPVALESGKWNHNYLRPFLQRHDIDEYYFNSNNEKIRLTSHCFRHTFAKFAVSDKGINPAVIQTHFKHLSIEMTMHYVHLTKTELKKSYIEGMIKSKNIITQGIEGKHFKQNITNIKSTQDLDKTLIELNKLYGINPLPYGLCLYDFKRGHCPHLGVQSCYMSNCGDFVTNETFLPNFQYEYKRLQDHQKHCKDHNLMIEVKKAEYQLQKIKKIMVNIKKEKENG